MTFILGTLNFIRRNNYNSFGITNISAEGYFGQASISKANSPYYRGTSSEFGSGRIIDNNVSFQYFPSRAPYTKGQLSASFAQSAQAGLDSDFRFFKLPKDHNANSEFYTSNSIKSPRIKASQFDASYIPKFRGIELSKSGHHVNDVHVTKADYANFKANPQKFVNDAILKKLLSKNNDQHNLTYIEQIKKLIKHASDPTIPGGQDILKKIFQLINQAKSEDLIKYLVDQETATYAYPLLLNKANKAVIIKEEKVAIAAPLPAPLIDEDEIAARAPLPAPLIDENEVLPPPPPPYVDEEIEEIDEEENFEDLPELVNLEEEEIANAPLPAPLDEQGNPILPPPPPYVEEEIEEDELLPAPPPPPYVEEEAEEEEKKEEEILLAPLDEQGNPILPPPPPYVEEELEDEEENFEDLPELVNLEEEEAEEEEKKEEEMVIKEEENVPPPPGPAPVIPKVQTLFTAQDLKNKIGKLNQLSDDEKNQKPLAVVRNNGKPKPEDLQKTIEKRNPNAIDQLEDKIKEKKKAWEEQYKLEQAKENGLAFNKELLIRASNPDKEECKDKNNEDSDNEWLYDELIDDINNFNSGYKFIIDSINPINDQLKFYKQLSENQTYKINELAEANTVNARYKKYLDKHKKALHNFANKLDKLDPLIEKLSKIELSEYSQQFIKEIDSKNSSIMNKVCVEVKEKILIADNLRKVILEIKPIFNELYGLNDNCDSCYNQAKTVLDNINDEPANSVNSNKEEVATDDIHNDLLKGLRRVKDANDSSIISGGSNCWDSFVSTNSATDAQDEEKDPMGHPSFYEENNILNY